jgi:serine/threonine protein kinase
MPLAVGTRLASYEILAAIGAGGMGEVYPARDSRLGRDVAIKVLPSHVAGDASSRQRFEREARTLATLSHPRDSHRELGDRLGAPITGLNPFGGLRCGGEPVTHAAHEIVVVQNFFEEMKRLAPAR